MGLEAPEQLSVRLGIVFLYTQFHSWFWEEFSGSLALPEQVVVFNFSERPLAGGQGAGNARQWQVFERSLGLPRLLLEVWRARRRVDRERFDLYLPHPVHAAGNHFFFSANVNTINLFEDGILNYYNASPTDFLRRKLEKRARYMRLFPLSYRLYEGHLSGIHATDRPLVGWFSQPDSVYAPERFAAIHPVSRAKPAFTPLANRVLILDQPLVQILPSEVAERLHNAFRRYLQTTWPQGEFIFKPHPSAPSEIRPEMQTLAPSLCEDNRPVEELVHELEPAAVISFCSSALVSIVNAHPGVRGVAYGLDVIEAHNPALADVIALFHRAGVECVASDP